MRNSRDLCTPRIRAARHLSWTQRCSLRLAGEGGSNGTCGGSVAGVAGSMASIAKRGLAGQWPAAVSPGNPASVAAWRSAPPGVPSRRQRVRADAARSKATPTARSANRPGSGSIPSQFRAGWWEAKAEWHFAWGHRCSFALYNHRPCRRGRKIWGSWQLFTHCRYYGFLDSEEAANPEEGNAKGDAPCRGLISGSGAVRTSPDDARSGTRDVSGTCTARLRSAS